MALSIDAQDEDVLIAVRALGDMRASRGPLTPNPTSTPGAPPTAGANASAGDGYPFHSSPHSMHPTPSLLSLASSTSSAPYPPTEDGQYTAESIGDPATAGAGDFVSRMSTFPLVNSALRAYENSKASSRVVKYGAEMMESSVKAVSKPVMNRLPVGQLDEFACRQLDRLGYGRVPNAAEDDMQLDSPIRAEQDTPPLPAAAAAVASGSGAGAANSDVDGEGEKQVQVASRSKWQAVLLEAGGIGAAVSVESMKRLKYCLQWLQYATARIDQQIAILRDFIASLNPPSKDGGPPNPDELISINAVHTLTNVKRDIVQTIRQVVDVVSKYAGGALPEPARARVRAVILHLPQRWASAAQQHQHQPQLQVPPPAHSRYYRPRPAPTGESSTAGAGRGNMPTAGSATQAAQRVLTLATESLDMMRNVTGVFKESLDRAEAWVERLRVLGIQRQHGDPTTGADDSGAPLTPSAEDPSGLQPPTPLASLSFAAAYASSQPTSPHALSPGSANSSAIFSTGTHSRAHTAPPTSDYGDDDEEDEEDEGGPLEVARRAKPKEMDVDS